MVGGKGGEGRGEELAGWERESGLRGGYDGGVERILGMWGRDGLVGGLVWWGLWELWEVGGLGGRVGRGGGDFWWEVGRLGGLIVRLLDLAFRTPRIVLRP